MRKWLHTKVIMSYQLEYSFTSYTSSLNAKLYDSAGAQVGSTITTGFVSLGNNQYEYLATIPDGHVGSFVIYDSANPMAAMPWSVNPQEANTVTEIINAIKAYEVETGHSFDNVMKRIYATNRGGYLANDPDDPTQILYYAPDGTTVRVTHSLTPTTRVAS